MKIILSNKAAFAYWAVKGLIESVGLFPIGTLVRLNTDELAVVVKINPQSPLRPIVNILIDAEGRELNEPKSVNLADNFVIHIEECADEQTG